MILRNGWKRVSQNGKGRDHNRNAFSLFLAGGGFKPGHVHGATDDVGYRSVQDIVTMPDLHATLLYQLGLDHTKLTFRHHGRDHRLRYHGHLLHIDHPCRRHRHFIPGSCTQRVCRSACRSSGRPWL